MSAVGLGQGQVLHPLLFPCNVHLSASHQGLQILRDLPRDIQLKDQTASLSFRPLLLTHPFNPCIISPLSMLTPFCQHSRSALSKLCGLRLNGSILEKTKLRPHTVNEVTGKPVTRWRRHSSPGQPNSRAFYYTSRSGSTRAAELTAHTGPDPKKRALCAGGG